MEALDPVERRRSRILGATGRIAASHVVCSSTFSRQSGRLSKVVPQSVARTRLAAPPHPVFGFARKVERWVKTGPPVSQSSNHDERCANVGMGIEGRRTIHLDLLLLFFSHRLAVLNRTAGDFGARGFGSYLVSHCSRTIAKAASAHLTPGVTNGGSGLMRHKARHSRPYALSGRRQIL